MGEGEEDEEDEDEDEDEDEEEEEGSIDTTAAEDLRRPSLPGIFTTSFFSNISSPLSSSPDSFFSISRSIMFTTVEYSGGLISYPPAASRSPDRLPFLAWSNSAIARAMSLSALRPLLVPPFPPFSIRLSMLSWMRLKKIWLRVARWWWCWSTALLKPGNQVAARTSRTTTIVTKRRMDSNERYSERVFEVLFLLLLFLLLLLLSLVLLSTPPVTSPITPERSISFWSM